MPSPLATRSLILVSLIWGLPSCTLNGRTFETDTGEAPDLYGSDTDSPNSGGTNSVVSSEPVGDISGADAAVDSGANSDADSTTPNNATPVAKTLGLACVNYFTTACERMKECGAVINCDIRIDTCPDRMFADGSQWTLELAASCGDEWKTFACEDVLVLKEPSCALVPGLRAVGDVCSMPSQCASGECSANAVGDYCGFCQEVVGLGENCGIAACEPGTYCGADGCEAHTPFGPVLVISQGEPCEPGGDIGCDDDNFCQSTGAFSDFVCGPLLSEGSVCASDECETELQWLGGLCVPLGSAGDNCETEGCNRDSFCDSSVSPKVCVKQGALGEPCTRWLNFGIESERCNGQLECLRPDDSWDVAYCADSRDIDESCNGTTEICRQGFECTDGACTGSGLRDLETHFCGG